MPIQKAKDFYIGKNNQPRLNCAQAVMAAFADKFALDNKMIDQFKNHGSGKAPEGVCGAYWAAKYLLKDLEMLKELDNLFTSLAGSLNCQEIRKKKRLSCLQCVEKAAEFVQNSISCQPS